MALLHGTEQASSRKELKQESDDQFEKWYESLSCQYQCSQSGTNLKVCKDLSLELPVNV